MEEVTHFVGHRYRSYPARGGGVEDHPGAVLAASGGEVLAVLHLVLDRELPPLEGVDPGL